MARRRPSSLREVEAATIGKALAALSAGALRELVEELLPWLDDRTRARLANAIVERAARGGTGWAPPRPRDEAVGDILSFAEAAKRAGYADAAEVDGYLRQGSSAFLGRDYRAAARILRALLVPVGAGEIDLGQHEMVDEVLGVDVATCAVQHVVATYVTAVPADRASTAPRCRARARLVEQRASGPPPVPVVSGTAWRRRTMCSRSRVPLVRPPASRSQLPEPMRIMRYKPPRGRSRRPWVG